MVPVDGPCAEAVAEHRRCISLRSLRIRGLRPRCELAGLGVERFDVLGDSEVLLGDATALSAILAQTIVTTMSAMPGERGFALAGKMLPPLVIMSVRSASPQVRAEQDAHR